SIHSLLRESMLGRNLITLFSTVNTPARFSSGPGTRTCRRRWPRRAHARDLPAHRVRAPRDAPIARKRINQGVCRACAASAHDDRLLRGAGRNDARMPAEDTGKATKLF